MFFTILFVCVILVAIILYLPYASGLTEIKIERQRNEDGKKNQESIDEQATYVPPDFQYSGEEEKQNPLSAKASSLRDRLNITSREMPLKIRLQQDTTLRKRNKGGVPVDTNPDTYDYDLDDLINEEEEQDAKVGSSVYNVAKQEKDDDMV